MYIGFYIDDFIIISSDLKYICVHKAMFTQQFQMTNKNDIEYILGIEIQWDPINHTLTLTKDKYLFYLLKKFNMKNCKPIATPMEANIQYLCS